MLRAGSGALPMYMRFGLWLWLWLGLGLGLGLGQRRVAYVHEASPARGVSAMQHRGLRRNQGGSDLGQLALLWLLSAPEHAPGFPKPRPASASLGQPAARSAPAGHTGFRHSCAQRRQEVREAARGEAAGRAECAAAAGSARSARRPSPLASRRNPSLPFAAADAGSETKLRRAGRGAVRRQSRRRSM